MSRAIKNFWKKFREVMYIISGGWVVSEGGGNRGGGGSGFFVMRSWIIYLTILPIIKQYT